MVKAFDDDTITITGLDTLAIESRARPWDNYHGTLVYKASLTSDMQRVYYITHHVKTSTRRKRVTAVVLGLSQWLEYIHNVIPKRMIFQQSSAFPQREG